MLSCPVCGRFSYTPVYSSERPASVLSLPKTKEESLNMVKYHMDFVQCDNCTHIYNMSFLPDTEMYHGAGCTMYNNGAGWQAHIRNQQSTLSSFYQYPRVVEIGAGDGSFLNGLDQPSKVAYEPSEDYLLCLAKGLETVHGYFDPAKDMPPPGSLLILRHVLEHFENPKEFIESIIANAQVVDLFIEVPCIENALVQKRVEDWVYEHPQHFTKASLEYLMKELGWQTMVFNKTYGGEVIVYYGRYSKPTTEKNLTESIQEAKDELSKIREKEQIVFWGGAGKSAMFLHEFSEKTDLVVDSDDRKYGKYVPGLELEIKDPTVLEKNPTIVVTTYWRADDILADIKSRGIVPKVVYAYSDGELVEIYRPDQREYDDQIKR